MNLSNEEQEFEDIKRLMAQLGNRLGEHLPKGWGFALFILQHGAGDGAHYVSSLDRNDMVTMLMEFIGRSQEKGFYGQHVDRKN